MTTYDEGNHYSYVASTTVTPTTVTNLSSTGGVDGNATDGTEDKESNNKITPPETPESNQKICTE